MRRRSIDVSSSKKVGRNRVVIAGDSHVNAKDLHYGDEHFLMNVTPWAMLPACSRAGDTT